MNKASPLRRLARRAGVGRLALFAYHRPTGLICDSIREGGPFEQRRTELGRREMVEAAKSLPPLQAPNSNIQYAVHFLTGSKYWYQTLFCAWSLQKSSQVAIVPVVRDDGSLKGDQIHHIRRAIPWARVVGREETERLLDTHLPDRNFPVLRTVRRNYVHLRKLTDIHCGGRSWALFLDSDILFFREPRFILDWLAMPSRFCHMVDVVRAYGYPDSVMEELAGFPIPPLVNTGICGLKGDEIDWELLERWCKHLVAMGMSYVLEQTLTAMLLAGKDRAAAPSFDYRVLPDLIEGRSPTAVAHHYVAESKRSYFQYGWRVMLTQQRD